MAEDDVTQADSSPAAAEAANADLAPVSGADQVGDRPVQNIVAEFNRKLGKTQDELNRKIDAVLQYLASGQAGQTQARPTPPQGNAELTDEDLWSQAQQGNRLAFEEYQRRIAAREFRQMNQVERQQNTVVSQLNSLVAKYPVLRDSSHPLTQHSHQAYQLLVQNGRPANQATLLEAAMTAIADRPDLVSEIYSQGGTAREQVRQTATSRAQAGATGVTHRRDSAPVQQGPKVSDASADLARRMGIKDPKAAKERFLKRQEEGRSSFGSVAAFIPEGDL
jgi:hypothetical protein